MTEFPSPDNAAFEYLYELYHKNLSSFVSESALEPESSPEAPSTPADKQYQRAPQVPLADPDSAAVPGAIRRRASYREPERRPITDTELATLLTYAYGEIREVDGEPRRPVASGGACYPLELYPIVLDSPNIDAGIYHYNGRDGALDQLAAGDYSDWLQEQWTWITSADTVAAAIVITALPGRSADRYGEMGYLLAALEAGAVIQNLQLLATELDIGSRPHNGIQYRALREQLRLRSEEYLLSSVVFAGRAPGTGD
ncbi:hypothetical protein DM826_00605 [Halonotius aquaticus]|uniref:Nitroreductase domain-containing protein n=1 Tax=Halonotius aquaticus TaxID=2216978 RepID=A0A3A6PS71_9EURY|nr:SagB/ThcOx family dehydrogenase [Halonotius aquaticus]RJX45229.1 hypothetical protein DM826_00605 [Halonotius aquaticus]